MNLKLLDINLDFKDKMNGFNEGLDVNINKSIRVLPSKDKEGFFIAKFKKLNWIFRRLQTNIIKEGKIYEIF
mgnify:FL=1